MWWACENKCSNPDARLRATQSKDEERLLMQCSYNAQ